MSIDGCFRQDSESSRMAEVAEMEEVVVTAEVAVAMVADQK